MNNDKRHTLLSTIKNIDCRLLDVTETGTGGFVASFFACYISRLGFISILIFILLRGTQRIFSAWLLLFFLLFVHCVHVCYRKKIRLRCICKNKIFKTAVTLMSFDIENIKQYLFLVFQFHLNTFQVFCLMLVE